MYILRTVFSDRWYSVCDIPATNERIYLWNEKQLISDYLPQ